VGEGLEVKALVDEEKDWRQRIQWEKEEGWK
jgi:hypothetical protein